MKNIINRLNLIWKMISTKNKFENEIILKKNISVNSFLIKYVSGELMKNIDDELMGEKLGYKLEQLMELAGLAVAQSIFKTILMEESWKTIKKILIISGPGSKINNSSDNGGDGLVCSRHLKKYGLDVDIYYPKIPKIEFFQVNSKLKRILSNKVRASK